MKRRLTKRAFIVALISGLLFLAGTTAQASWLFVIAAGVFGLVFGSLFMRHHLRNAEVMRSVPRRARVGDEVRVGISVRNSGKRRLPLMRLEDDYAAFQRTAVLVESVDPGSTAHVELVKKAHRRGAFGGGDVRLVSGAPFGFLATRRRVEVASELVVVPRWVEMRTFPILEPSSFPSDVLHERARTGAGEEFIGVRDYRPGDPPRYVHWRSTARAGHLVVREFEEEVASRVCLVLSGADTGVPPSSVFETLVSAAASIGIYALQTGHPIDMVRAASGGGVEQIAGPDRFALLDWLARAEPVDAPLTKLAAESLDRVGRRGTVVLFTPTTGASAASVSDAIKVVQSSGSRAIVISGRSSSWVRKGERPVQEVSLEGIGGGRAATRTISKGDDLLRCIES